MLRLREHGIAHATATRWMRLAEGYPQMLQLATFDTIDEALRSLNPAHVSRNTGETHWDTPPEILEAARAVLLAMSKEPGPSAVASACNDFERLCVRRFAQSVQAACRIWQRGGSAHIEASILMARAERAIAEADPPTDRVEQATYANGRRHGANGSGIYDWRARPSRVQANRRAVERSWRRLGAGILRKLLE